MSRPEGFEYVERGKDVVILHRGRSATTLRGRRASDFLEDVEGGGGRGGGGASSAEAQELMARLTGNYRRGNERAARNHPRNAGR